MPRIRIWFESRGGGTPAESPLSQLKTSYREEFNAFVDDEYLDPKNREWLEQFVKDCVLGQLGWGWDVMPPNEVITQDGKTIIKD